MSNDNFENWNTGASNGQGSNNANNAMLNLNDDYTNILNNLGNSQGQLVSDNSAQRQDLQQAQQSPYNLPNLNSRSSSEKQPNLDLLLQHYQELFSRSGAGSVGSSPNASGGSAPNMSSRALAAQENKSVIAQKPCDHCRRRQIKCVITPDLANCVQCENKGIKCAYSELPFSRQANETAQDKKKRGRVDENVNVHELLKRSKQNSNESVSQYYSDLLQNLSQTSNKGVALENNQNSVKMNNSSPYNMLGSNSQNELLSKDTANSVQHSISPSNLTNGSSYNVNSSMAQKMAYTQPPIQYPRSSFYVGPTSVFDINLVNHVKLDKIDQIQLSKTLALRKVAPNVQFLLRDDLNQELYMKQEQEIDMVEKLVHPHGKILVDIFFKLVHPYFPILHERVFLEKYSRSYRELTAPLLAALYSLSLQWWDFHPQLVGFPKPDVIDRLNEIALRTFFDIVERPKLSIIQTGLLILQCRSESSSNWVICSEVVALAEDLGLGVDCQDWRLPGWERGLRRRLAWAVWIQDKWTSMMEARYSHLILGRNWLVKMLTDEDFPDSSPVINGSSGGNHVNNQMLKDVTSPVGNISMLDMTPTAEDFRNGKLMFQHMVSLSIILGEVLDTFYTLGALKTVTKMEQVLKLAKPLQLKMREWYHSLPSQLSMSSFQERKFSSNASLTLSYFAVELTLHRKIITTLSGNTSPELVQVCRLAAKTRLIAAIEFVRDLKFEHINSFWYTCSTGNLTLIGTFAALLYVTAPTKEESVIFRDCLRNYVWILRMSSKGFEKAENGLKKVHMLLAQIPGLLTDDPIVPQQPQQSFIPPSSQSPHLQQQHLQQQPQQQHASQQPYTTTSVGQSPYNNQNSFNQLKQLPPEILQQLASLQNNMPSVNMGNSPGRHSKASEPRDDKTGAPRRSESDQGLPDFHRMSPGMAPLDLKSSPRNEDRGNSETFYPSAPDQLHESEATNQSRNKAGEKSKILTPQSVNGANGKAAKSSGHNEDNPQEGIGFDMKREGSHISPASLAESNGAEKSSENGSHKAAPEDGNAATTTSLDSKEQSESSESPKQQG